MNNQEWIDWIRKTVPNAIAEELISVQPIHQTSLAEYELLKERKALENNGKETSNPDR